MKIELVTGLAVALGLSLLANGVIGWRLAGAKARCETSKAVATGKANEAVRKEEGKRDTKLDKVTTETKADTRKEVGTVEKQTNARAEAIDRARTDGGCRRPVGLPPLDAAVDQANSAAGD